MNQWEQQYPSNIRSQEMRESTDTKAECRALDINDEVHGYGESSGGALGSMKEAVGEPLYDADTPNGIEWHVMECKCKCSAQKWANTGDNNRRDATSYTETRSSRTEIPYSPRGWRAGRHGVAASNTGFIDCGRKCAERREDWGRGGHHRSEGRNPANVALVRSHDASFRLSNMTIPT